MTQFQSTHGVTRAQGDRDAMSGVCVSNRCDARVRRWLTIATAGVVVTVASCSGSSSTKRHALLYSSKGKKTVVVPNAGLSKIKHIVMIMQENRSFDSYFGTYPGADGLPKDVTGFSTCLPDPKAKTCVKPYHDPNDVNAGSKHSAAASVTSVNGGKMDGFVKVARGGQRSYCAKDDLQNPVCTAGDQFDVMGYHDARELPTYWKYASDYVLQDRMFAPVASWSLPSHLYMVSAWSALCKNRNVDTCVNNIVGPYVNGKKIREQVNAVLQQGKQSPINFAWTNITHLLHQAHVNWGYFIEAGSEPDCADDEAVCAPVFQTNRTPGIWNPLPLFNDVRNDGELKKIQDLSAFRTAAKKGDLPAVSWIVPDQNDSEHPPASIKRGQAWVKSIVDDIMNGPNWDSTAIFVSWDDWGGFYDHVVPPKPDENGYGIRVPGLEISAYAKRGYIDHQTLSHDAYLKFIEDVFLGGARLDPTTDGRGDARPSVRENAPILGDLSKDFDFTQPPRKPAR